MKKILTILLVALATISYSQSNDFCVNADVVDSLLMSEEGETLFSKVYNNDNAGLDSIVFEAGGFECFAEPLFDPNVPLVETTLWYTFTGTGDLFLIQSENCNNSTNFIDFGDTQAVLYEGTCADLTPVSCSEDGFEATEDNLKFGIEIYTEVGVQYYLMVDGFNFQGDLSLGDFCLSFTNIPKTYCEDLNTGGLNPEGDSLFCADEVVIVPYNLTDVVIPNSEEGKKGIVWFARIGNSYDEITYQDILDDTQIVQVTAFDDRTRPRGVSFANTGANFTQDTFWTFFPVVIAGVDGPEESLNFFDYELGDGCIVPGDLVKIYISSEVECDILDNVNNLGFEEFSFKGNVYDFGGNQLGSCQSKDQFIREFQQRYSQPLIICDENGVCQSYYLIK